MRISNFTDDSRVYQHYILQVENPMPLLSNLLSPMSSVLYTMSYVAISPCPIHCVEGQDQCNSMFFSLKKTRLKYDKKLISVSSFLFSLKFSNVQTDSCHYELPMTDYYILYYVITFQLHSTSLIIS